MAPAQAHLQRIYAFHLQLQCNTDTAHAVAHRLTTARNNKLQICCSSKMQIERRSKRTKRIVMKCTLNLHRLNYSSLQFFSLFVLHLSFLSLEIFINVHLASAIGYRRSLFIRTVNLMRFLFLLDLDSGHRHTPNNFVK